MYQIGDKIVHPMHGAGVPVDYTPVRNVKKPAGARPGMVVYETYRTLRVTPDVKMLPTESGK